jgi:hypothetical protein
VAVEYGDQGAARGIGIADQADVATATVELPGEVVAGAVRTGEHHRVDTR